jgi:hypothetical protein
MIEIRYLVASFVLAGAAFSTTPAYSQDKSEVNRATALWACGETLLPCRSRNKAATTTLPYWRGNAPAQPIPVTYTPAFQRTYR